MATTVTIRVLNDLLPAGRVSGVLVRVNEADGPFVTDGTTDINGEVTFLLPAAGYDLLFYKTGLSCPVNRLVVEDGDPELWSVAGHVHTAPESADPYLCRVTGNFLTAAGRPARDAKLVFTPLESVISLAGELMVPSSDFQVSPDADGYVEFDLIRGAHYEVYFFGVTSLFDQPPKLDIIVPDRASAPLTDLLFPIHVEVEFSTDHVDLTVGTVDDSVTFVSTFSDGSTREIPPAWSTVLPTNSDSTVVEVTALNGKLSLRPLQAGTATISMERTIADKLLWKPDLPPFSAGSVTVTVE